mmetsp:Transcript_19739/g.33913  ORF Transcript_19739/g.33913 Transcript_19739/m.33913 type:complete len:470 (+) Transcript_19739:42-1451(+)
MLAGGPSEVKPDNISNGSESVTVPSPAPTISNLTLAGKEEEEEPAIPDSGLDPKDEENQIEIQQNDPNSPLYSVKRFEDLGLKEELLQGIYGMKFNKPSKIQESSLPMILSNPPRNLIAQAHNGSGKTACFVLGMLSRVDSTVAAPQALCVVPTRELARQTMEVAQRMGKYTPITYYLAVKEDRGPEGTFGGKRNVTEQVVIGTVGTVKMLIERRMMNTASMKLFVLDEADEMLDTQGFGDDSIRIRKAMPRSCQMLLFSATYADHVAQFAAKMAGTETNVIKVKREQLSLEGVKQMFIDCQRPERRFTILSDMYALLTIGQSIIFVNTRDTAQELARRMRQAEHTVSLLMGGDMSMKDRDDIIDDFRRGQSKVLITTNVLSRGIDISQVTLVINYDVPFNKHGKPDPETYLHRIGRTGRFGKKGAAITFICDHKSRQAIQFLQQFFNKPITEVPADKIEDLETKLKEK